jgi:hypothetical protein
MSDARRFVMILIVALLPTRAWAQTAEAEKLFRDGKQLMKDGKLAEACAAFEGSEHIEHNLASLLSLADCREKNGQYASAWGLFLQVESQTRTDAKNAAFNGTAKTRAAELEPRLSYLTINVPDESRIEGLALTRDGVAVDPAEWNRSVPIDGGTHVIAGKAPGHEEWSTKIAITAEKDKKSVEVPKFKDLPKLAHPELGTAQQPLPPAAPAESSMFTPHRKIAVGLVVGGAVVAGVALGFAFDANNLRNNAVATCPPQSCSVANAQTAQEQNDHARDRATVANIGFGVAGAAAIAGVVVWLLNSPDEPTSTGVGLVPTTNGVSFAGRF